MKRFAIEVLFPFGIHCLLAYTFLYFAFAGFKVETKTFTAKCPLFVGTVTKQGDKFYNKHGKEIWLPLKECYLEEK
jgi:hypothetical protein